MWLVLQQCSPLIPSSFVSVCSAVCLLFLISPPKKLGILVLGFQSLYQILSSMCAYLKSLIPRPRIHIQHTNSCRKSVFCRKTERGKTVNYEETRDGWLSR
jgi:hypothetical protein